ncbi:hypothetical protein [Streptomyces sp. STCH 565 A]|uniref:hypothetical protein n=1 Tax=Streptomyces sp. STCH 565 A TaxID=2950532 RepID=UPI002075768D|nr:hypothetical protein [Streptomyces sp. STCH 565 A]MCM8548878.1 hypothetical protein [Streptomyces sp. STCH 565 A]
MPDPQPVPVRPRPDDAAADMGSLVELGMAPEQPEPSLPGQPPPSDDLDPPEEPTL